MVEQGVVPAEAVEHQEGIVRVEVCGEDTEGYGVGGCKRVMNSKW